MISPRDYLERYRDPIGDGGFRVFLDRGGLFHRPANTDTQHPHRARNATLFTGSYTSGNTGIVRTNGGTRRKRSARKSVEDGTTQTGRAGTNWPAASPTP